MSLSLSKDQQRIYDIVFQHPISSNLERRDVRTLFEALGEVTDEQNGNLKIERNGHTLMLHPPHSFHPAAYEEVMQIRHFLETSDIKKEKKDDGAQICLLVVVEHRKITVYRTAFQGSVPEQFVPHSTHSSPRHGFRAQERDGDQSEPANPEFFKEAANSLQDADEILIFGTGEDGKKSMEDLITELRVNHKDLFERIVGSHMVGGKRLTDDLLLEKARQFYLERQDM